MPIQIQQPSSIGIGSLSGDFSYITAAATFTALSYADNGGKVQISSAGAHGLTSSPAVGKRIYVSWSDGTGVTGFYTILTLDTALAITIDLTHAVGLGTPTVSLTTTQNTLGTIIVPGGRMRTTSKVGIQTYWEFTGSTNSKTARADFGSTTNGVFTITTASNISFRAEQWVINSGSLSSQLLSAGTNFGVANISPSTGSENTANDVAISFRCSPGAANEYMSLRYAYVYLDL